MTFYEKNNWSGRLAGVTWKTRQIRVETNKARGKEEKPKETTLERAAFTLQLLM